MTQEEADKLYSETTNAMIILGTSGHMDETPLKTIFMGLSSALLATSSVSKEHNEDLKESAIDMLEALEKVMQSARFMMEVDVQNQIDDLTK